jgi:hypothetical protein
MIELSEIHRLRFGYVTARAEIETAVDLRTARDYCVSTRVQLLIVRLPTEQLSLAQELLAEGGLLTDTLCVFQRKLVDGNIAPDPSIVPPDEMIIRLAVPEDFEPILKIARVAFRNYPSHYHADLRLDRQACDDLYVDWASRLCAKGSNFITWVVEMHGMTAGFMGGNYANRRETILELGAISPSWRGHNLYRHLARAHVVHSVKVGVERVFGATQTVNLPAQITLIREGFFPSGSYYTIHKWFDH